MKGDEDGGGVSEEFLRYRSEDELGGAGASGCGGVDGGVAAVRHWFLSVKGAVGVVAEDVMEGAVLGVVQGRGRGRLLGFLLASTALGLFLFGGSR
jgi:hypothetical protein